MKRFPKCETTRKDPKISLKENKSKIVLENPERLEVCILEVDGCAIREGLRCDYAMTIDGLDQEFFIELKGHDINHAFKQLEATIQKISTDPQQNPKICFVVSMRSPLSAPEIQKMQKMMKDKYQAILVVKNSPHTHTIAS
jgi:hypothetical protein